MDQHAGSVACIAAITDVELEAEALAADPDAPLSADAVSLWSLGDGSASSPLPDWYMPAAMAGVSSRWRRRVAIALIVAFVLIYAYGLCSTYGRVELA
jgi:hypothetical protein